MYISAGGRNEPVPDVNTITPLRRHDLVSSTHSNAFVHRSFLSPQVQTPWFRTVLDAPFQLKCLNVTCHTVSYGSFAWLACDRPTASYPVDVTNPHLSDREFWLCTCMRVGSPFRAQSMKRTFLGLHTRLKSRYKNRYGPRHDSAHSHFELRQVQIFLGRSATTSYFDSMQPN